MAYHLVSSQMIGRPAEPHGVTHPAFAPYGEFRTADGGIMIGVASDSLFARFCQAIEREEWADDPRFATNAARMENRALLTEEIDAVLVAAPAAVWLGRLEEKAVPHDRVQNTLAVLEDPQAIALGIFDEVTLPGSRSVKVPRLPVTIDGARPRYGSLSPDLDSERLAGDGSWLGSEGGV